MPGSSLLESIHIPPALVYCASMSVDQGRRHAGLVPNRTPQTVRARYDRATADLDPPLALVDLGAFDRNAADLTRRAAGHPVRVATKSLRCRFLIERALAFPGYRGVMCYSLAEALWLHATGTSDDLLVAYPSVDRGALRAPAAGSPATPHPPTRARPPRRPDAGRRGLRRHTPRRCGVAALTRPL